MLPTTDGDRGHAISERYVGFDGLTRPVKPHLKRLSEFMRSQVEEFEPELQKLVAFCLRNSGKRIRPMLVFYSGWRDTDAVSESLVKASAVIELVHLATLVHDDILDEAKMRHNDATVTEKYGAGVAVLLGDALFSHALKLASDFPTIDVCRAVSKSTRRVCAGEIGQTFQRGNPSITLEDYYRIIDYKTAELFYVSCHLGAKLSGFDDDFVEAAGRFGRHLGIAYQIFDDLADFTGHEKNVGKTLGTDLASGKFTLPLILLLRRLDRAGIQALIKEVVRDENADIDALNEVMLRKGIFDEVAACFQREIDAADAAIAPFVAYAPVPCLQDISQFVRAQIHRFMKP